MKWCGHYCKRKDAAKKEKVGLRIIGWELPVKENVFLFFAEWFDTCLYDTYLFSF